ncbi:MAG: bestrophin family ion channel [Sandaracinaceae bacterium]
MIRYEPHPHWWTDIVRLPISYALRRALMGTVLMGVYAACLVSALELAFRVELPHGAAALSVVGGTVSLGLAFRINNAYARWWEGRQHWGLLVNHCRNLANLVHAMWDADDATGRRRMAGLVGDFVVGLSLHLRGELTAKDLESLADDERAHAASRTHPLSYVSELVWREVTERNARGTLDTGRLLLLQPHAAALLDVLGACERIRNTPIPFALTAVIRGFLLLFALLVPLGLHADLGWSAIPIAMVAFFVLAAVDVLAAELENPFGIDCNDLPTRSLAEMIRRQVHEALRVAREGSPDQQPLAPPLFTKIR